MVNSFTTRLRVQTADGNVILEPASLARQSGAQCLFGWQCWG